MCFSAGVPVVSGTTSLEWISSGYKGWCIRENKLYSLLRILALVSIFSLKSIRSSHHWWTHRLSMTKWWSTKFIIQKNWIHRGGTAISLADQIIQYLPRIKSWKNYSADESMRKLTILNCLFFLRGNRMFPYAYCQVLLRRRWNWNCT